MRPQSQLLLISGLSNHCISPDHAQYCCSVEEGVEEAGGTSPNPRDTKDGKDDSKIPSIPPSLPPQPFTTLSSNDFKKHKKQSHPPITLPAS